MTGQTIGGVVSSQQWETAGLMNFGNVTDQPGARIVTTDTIEANRVVVHVGVTIDTIGFCIVKNQGCVARFAIGKSMLPIQHKIG
jgi:hypothetical protein